jgi:hypothetical protein
MARRSSATGTPVPERLVDVDATGALGTDKYTGARKSSNAHTISHQCLSGVMDNQRNLDEAASLLGTLAGTTTDRAKRLIDAVSTAGSEQALDTITGAGSVPSNLTNSRAEFLHAVTMNFGDTISDDEVEVVFRCTKTAAKSIISTMNATFASSIRELQLAKMRSEAMCSRSGDATNGLTWTVCFNSEVGFETAVDEIERLKRRTEIKVDVGNFCIEFPIEPHGSEMALIDALGISVPQSPARPKKPRKQ